LIFIYTKNNKMARTRSTPKTNEVTTSLRQSSRVVAAGKRMASTRRAEKAKAVPEPTHEEIMAKVNSVSKVKDDFIPSGHFWIYVRVSTQRQGDNEHVSIESQETYIREFIKTKDWTAEEVHVEAEAVSARYMEKQKRLQHILRNVRPGDIVITYDTSRFSRNLSDAMSALRKIYNKGARFWTAYEGVGYHGPSKHIISQGIAHAELESDKLSEKVKLAKAYCKARGDVTGPVPFGKKVARVPVSNRRVFIDDPSASKLKGKIYKLYFDKEQPSYKDFATLLNEQGLKTDQSFNWTEGKVKRFFKTPLNDMSSLHDALDE
jgi:DNA invertase Pin-like site-specific DNA recombinase